MADHGSNTLRPLLAELERRLTALCEAVPPLQIIDDKQAEQFIMLEKINRFNRVRAILYPERG